MYLTTLWKQFTFLFPRNIHFISDDFLQTKALLLSLSFTAASVCLLVSVFLSYCHLLTFRWHQSKRKVYLFSIPIPPIYYKYFFSFFLSSSVICFILPLLLFMILLTLLLFPPTKALFNSAIQIKSDWLISSPFAHSHCSCLPLATAAMQWARYVNNPLISSPTTDFLY